MVRCYKAEPSSSQAEEEGKGSRKMSREMGKSMICSIKNYVENTKGESQSTVSPHLTSSMGSST